MMLARFVPYVVSSLLTALSCLTISASAHADDDHDRAHKARMAGKIKPLSQVLQELSQRHPGQVLEVELEHHDQRWMYEIKLLTPDGRVRKFDIDATNATTPKKEH